METEKPKLNIEGTPKPEDVEKIQSRIEKGDIKSETEVKKEIKSYLEELQIAASNLPPKNKRDEADEISQIPENQQVIALVSLVFDKGLKTAIEVARGIDNPAVLDEFHDALADKYYEELVKRGLIK